MADVGNILKYANIEQNIRRKINDESNILSRKKDPLQWTVVDKEHRHPKSNSSLRWLMFREIDINEAYTHIEFWVNPNECTWQVGLRSATTITSSGAIHHEVAPNYFDSTGTALPDPDYTRFELPILNISFQAGIILEGAYLHINHKDGHYGLPKGLGNFYDFLSLIDQPNQFIDSAGIAVPNFVHIFYVSPTFGAKGIWLKGFFLEDGISWSDSTEQPLTISNWKASFMVCKSSAPLNALKSNYESVKLNPSENTKAIIQKEKNLREQAQKKYRSEKQFETIKAQFVRNLIQRAEAREVARLRGDETAYSKSLANNKRLAAANMLRDDAERRRVVRNNNRL